MSLNEVAGYKLAPSVAAALAADRRRIVITGAGGWLGQATLELLHNALGGRFDERVVCFGSSDRVLTLRDGTVIPQHALSRLPALSAAPTILLHLAFLTKDRAETMDEDSYRVANRTVSETVAQALNVIDARSVFVASSGAARRAGDPSAGAAMRLYGELKAADESLFVEWAVAGDGRTAVIARIFNISGPYINKHGAYALANFINAALAGDRVTVKARGAVYRSFVAIEQLMSLVFALLLNETGVVRFDTAGDEVVEMRDLATLVSGLVGNGDVDAATIDPAVAGDTYVGDAKNYTALRSGWGIPGISLKEQILRTADDLRRQRVRGV